FNLGGSNGLKVLQDLARHFALSFESTYGFQSYSAPNLPNGRFDWLNIKVKGGQAFDCLLGPALDDKGNPNHYFLSLRHHERRLRKPPPIEYKQCVSWLMENGFAQVRV
ncbi:MAG: hypothetical protein WCI73_01545, partial [Phycisphaerae bacterium]